MYFGEIHPSRELIGVYTIFPVVWVNHSESIVTHGRRELLRTRGRLTPVQRRNSRNGGGVGREGRRHCDDIWEGRKI